MVRMKTQSILTTLLFGNCGNRRKRADKSARAASRQRRQERGRQRGRSRNGLLGSFAGAGRAGPGLSGQAGVDLILYGLGWSQRHQLLTTRRFRPLSPKGIAGPPYLRVAGAPRLNAEVAEASVGPSSDRRSLSGRESRMWRAE